MYKEFPSMGGEDFSYFTDAVPSAFYHLGGGNVEKGIVEPLHNKDFRIDEESLRIGVLMQVESVLSLLNS